MLFKQMIWTMNDEITLDDEYEKKTMKQLKKITIVFKLLQ